MVDGLSLELQLRGMLKDVYNKLDEAKTLVAAMLITSDYNTDDLTMIQDMVNDALRKLDEAKRLVEQLEREDYEVEFIEEVS